MSVLVSTSGCVLHYGYMKQLNMFIEMAHKVSLEYLYQFVYNNKYSLELMFLLLLAVCRGLYNKSSGTRKQTDKY